MDNEASDDTDYEVGYKKPPKMYQFKKGNRAAAGRRKSKQQQNTEEMLARLFNEKVTVALEGKKVRMPWKEAIMRSLLSESRKSTRDMFRLLELMREFQIDLVHPDTEVDNRPKIILEFVGDDVKPVHDTCIKE